MGHLSGMTKLIDPQRLVLDIRRVCVLARLVLRGEGGVARPQWRPGEAGSGMDAAKRRFNERMSRDIWQESCVWFTLCSLTALGQVDGSIFYKGGTADKDLTTLE